MAMEEAMMLQAPLRVLGGSVQGRDFDYFYGPLSLWVPAVFYKVFAPTLLVERFVGACYLAVLGIALYVIGRLWAFWIALAMGATAILIGALSMTALPITGAIALLVVGVACTTARWSQHRRDWCAGIALGLSVSLRPDFLVWALVLLVVLQVISATRARAWFGLLVGLVPYVVLVLRAGWGSTWRTLVSDGLHVGAERNIPFDLQASGRGLMVVIAAASMLGACVLGFVTRREQRGKALIGLGVIGLCLVPEYVQRADGIHVVYVTMVPLATLFPVVYELLGMSTRLVSRSHVHQWAAIGIAGVLLLGIQPKFLARSTLRDARFIGRGGLAYTAHTPGGVWYYQSPRSATEHERLARAAQRIYRPGDVLFVGPTNLARTSFSDGSFYTLLPRFAQKTRYYDFHPRISLVYGHRLASDVASADVVVLCDVGFNEDNLSKRRGSERANRVVATQFDLVTTSGHCRLYRKKMDGKGASNS